MKEALELSTTLTKTDFTFSNQTKVYKGKVRDVYSIGDDLLIMVASDRISAFDHVLPKGIPFKGQVLNQIAAKFLRATEDIVPNWLITLPDSTVSIGYRCETYPIEMVIRGYLAGHAWREYKSGKRMICGVPMPNGMKENDKFPQPIITPATKAEEGHDEDISREEILAKGIISERDYIQLEDYTRKLFQRGTEMAEKQGLILVDTKYEFGNRNGMIHLIDEIHTPDSSRYFYTEGYKERQERGEVQKQLSKEFVREWLMKNNFQGLEGQTMPVMPDEFVQTVSARYIELYEMILGEQFKPVITEEICERIEENVVNFLKGFKG
jgi:phosphoribosylaminoimidazole-succinocarboxamide synthase